ncbi:ABC transporter permease [uncultured Piscinibacter sp.]|uniref:ABC transporter permease n=1 Tax=uncultured Piscinibacter sp. TaxID=1131835 RepID=UPI00261CBD44|nr:ABC transporter permease [uncultured Piscinibacter sp.]
MVLRLAWRNVLRHWRRSLITALAIAVGVAALTFLWAFIDGINAQMVENSTRYFAGDAQVHARGYQDDPGPERAMADAGPAIDAARLDPGVLATTPRLEAAALASRGEKSRGVRLVGVDIASEDRVTDLARAVVEGQGLAAGDPGVLIGSTLARALAVGPGQEIVLLGQGFDGSVASARLPVRGVFRTQIDAIDGTLAVASMEVVREFFVAPRAATAVALRLRDRTALAAVQARLAQRLGPDYEVIGWPRLLPSLPGMIRFHDVMGYVVLTIFFVMVGAGIANPVLMAVLERTREFGVMLALGAGRARVLGLVLAESVLLGGFGLLLGNALGLAATALFGRLGIDLGAFEAGMRTMPGLADIVYPVLQPQRSALISVLVFTLALLAAVYPATKAARLEPVAALRGMAGSSTARAQRRVPGRLRRVAFLPLFVRIAQRNLLRNPRRSALTVGGTAFAIVSYVFINAYFDGFDEQLIDTATRYITGHVQLERPGFRRDQSPQLAFGPVQPQLDTLRGLPEVAAAAPRVQAQALVSTARKSAGVLLVGVDPAAEAGLTLIGQAILRGRMLNAGDDHAIVLGRKLAERLGVVLGEKLVVTASSVDGELGSAAYRLEGIFATESVEFDDSIAFMTLPDAQALLGLAGKVSTINVRLKSRDRLPAFLATLRARSGDLAVVPWPELLPAVEQMIGLDKAIRAVVVGLFLTVVALAVMNTVVMSVTERTREFGVLMALGTTPAAVVRMVLYETAALMVLASVLGYALGAALVGYFGRFGLDLSGLFAGYDTIPGLTGITYPRLVLSSIVLPGVALFAASVLVSLLPASRAARLDPAQAIRHA